MKEEKFSIEPMKEKRECLLPLLRVMVQEDTSFSLAHYMANSKKCYWTTIECLMKSIERLREEEFFTDNVFVYLSTLGKGDVALKGAAVLQRLVNRNKLKQERTIKNIGYARLVLRSPLEEKSPDNMKEEIERVRERVCRRCLDLLAYGIGDADSRFSMLEEMVACYRYGTKILTSKKEVCKYFYRRNKERRYLPFEKNFFITPMAKYAIRSGN